MSFLTTGGVCSFLHSTVLMCFVSICCILQLTIFILYAERANYTHVQRGQTTHMSREGKLHTCPERANYTYVQRGQTTHMSREGKLHICPERANYTYVQRGQTTHMSREGKLHTCPERANYTYVERGQTHSRIASIRRRLRETSVR